MKKINYVIKKEACMLDDELNDKIVNLLSNKKIDNKTKFEKATYFLKILKHANLKGSNGKNFISCCEDLDVVEFLLKNGADANVRDGRKRTPLFDVKTKEKIELLIKYGADVNAVDDSKNTPLLSMILGGDVKVLETLIDNGAKLEAKDGFGRTALMNAVIWGEKKIVKVLIAKGAEVNDKDVFDCPPLIEAVKKDDLELVKILVDAGGDVNLCDNWGQDALYYAIKCEDNEIAKFIVKSGADVKSKKISNRRNGKVAYNPLCLCIEEEKTELAKCLIDKGVDIDEVDENGKCAIIKAVEMNNAEIVDYLIKHDCNVEVKSKGGKDLIDMVKDDEVYALIGRAIYRKNMEEKKEQFKAGVNKIFGRILGRGF